MKLHLEITSKCALSCPSCARSDYQKNNPIGDLSIETIIKNLDFPITYDHILLSGNHGDPIYHNQFHEVIKWLQDLAPMTPLIVATNGSFRDAEWWKEAAQILRPIDYVTFAIDGLEDTNSIYRKNSDWPSIMTAIQTLKKNSKCRIQWQWILFKHNQHQVHKAALLAKRLGVHRFFIMKSSRDNFGMNPTITLADVLKEVVL